MPPTPLETYWTGRVATAATAKTNAGAAFDQARTAHAAARTELTTDQDALAVLGRAVEAKRRSLSEPGISPAELAARVAQLRALLAQFRAKHREVLDGEAALDLGQRTLTARQADFERARAAHQAATDEAAAATARAKRWADATAALGSEPLSTLKTRATNATKPADAIWSAAKTRVEAEIPKELRDRAVERQTAAVSLVPLAKTARAEIAALLATGRASELGATPAAAAGLTGAEGALFGHVQRGQARFERAQTALSGIPRSTVLTAAERAAIDDADRVSKGKAAVLLEKARDDKAAELAAKRAERETAERQLLAADIDTDLTVALAALDAQIATLNGELATAEGAYAAKKADLDDWEAAVPDSAWANLQAFETARRELGELAALVPANLLTAIDTATTALVTALGTDHKRARTLDYLRGEDADEAGRNEVVLGFAERRTAAAVRGE